MVHNGKSWESRQGGRWEDDTLNGFPLPPLPGGKRKVLLLSLVEGIQFFWFAKEGAFEQSFAYVPAATGICGCPNLLPLQTFPFLKKQRGGVRRGAGGNRIKWPSGALLVCVCLLYRCCWAEATIDKRTGYSARRAKSGAAFSVWPVTWAQLTGEEREALISSRHGTS